MAKILDPDSLTYLVNGSPVNEHIQINTTTKKIKINPYGALTAADGVTGQCLFSKLKEIIKASSILISVALPIREMIHDESMELINGWTLFDSASEKLVRDCGLAYVNAAGQTTAMFACMVSLGTLAAGTTTEIYCAQSNSTSAATIGFTYVNTGLTYGVNELIQIYSNPTGVSVVYDYRSYFKMFLRRQGYTYDEASNADIGYPVLTYKKYNFPITHVVDTGVTKNDATVDAYTGMSITWGTYTGIMLGANGPYAYHVQITAASHTYDEIYSWVQRQLRKTTAIDTGKNGNVTPALVFMDGAILTTKLQAAGGVHIASPSATSYNNIKEADDTGTLRSYPLSVSVVAEFDSFLQGDAASYFWIFKTSDYGTPSAVPLLDSGSAQMKGAANVASASFAYNYSTNIPLTGIALGAGGAKIAVATGTLTAAGAKLVFVAGQERWYSNP